jgi:2-C-methyl-D-erythritol 4-phosphate cytidylyltransferase
LLGAGSGTRMGNIPKAFLYLHAQTLLERALCAMAPFCSEIIVGLRAADMELAYPILDKLALPHAISLVTGGAERQDTVSRLVERATRPVVLLHEVARPFAEPENFAAVLANQETGAAALYTPLQVRDGLAIISDGVYQSALPRSQVVALQTPHAYRREILLHAHRQAQILGHREDSTVALVQWAGYRVLLVLGCTSNIKITYEEDWRRLLAETQPREHL